MELLNANELPLAVERIMKQTVRDGDCIIWRPKHAARQPQNKQMKTRPTLRIGTTSDTRMPCIDVLWQYNYGTPKPALLDHVCANGMRCLNVNHKQPFKRKPKPQRQRRRYTRHTDQCPGPDPILIERLATAGTLDVISFDHILCDCERAWLINNTDFSLRELSMSSTAARRITN